MIGNARVVETEKLQVEVGQTIVYGEIFEVGLKLFGIYLYS